MAAAIRRKDWSDSPLGPIEGWPSELKCAVDLVLNSKYPHFVAWGSDMMLLFNDAYAEVLDDPEGALGMRFSELWADAWSTIGPIARAALAGTGSYFEDLPIKMARPGRWALTWWTFSYSPVRSSDGSVGGIFCTVTETTHHKQLERKLEESEKSLRRFTDLVPNFLWESTALGHFSYMNRRMLSYTGFSAPDQARDWTDFVHPDDIPIVVQAYADAQNKHGKFECQHRIRAGDGSYRWFLARAQPVFDDDGTISGWCGCATDINNWRLAVEHVRQSAEQVRNFAENAARIFWIADISTGNVEFLNAAGRRFWAGGEEGKIQSWDDWYGIIHPDHHTPVANAIDRIRSGETVTGTYRAADGQNHYSDLRTILFPITEEDGGIAKFGGIAELIETKQRRLVHLVDPDREGHRKLSAQLWAHGFEVRGFTDVHAFAKVAPALLPGCVLIRATAHTGWAARVVAAAQQQRGRLHTVVMTEQHRDADHIRELMKQGASDVLPHNADWAALEAAIDEATRDLEQAAAAASERSSQAQDKIAQLSAREREILTRLTGGATNKVVAIALGISPRTVEAHRARILEKLEVSTLAEAVAITVSAGIS